MTMKSLTARAILVAGMLVLGVVGPNAAIAAPPQPGGTAPLAKILLIDLRRVMSDSKVGQDMQQQIKALKAQATNELNGEGRALQGEKTQLEQQAAILAPDVKARRIKDFEARASAFQEKVQKRGGMIQGGVMKAQQQVEQALGPILEGVMHERGATILLDRSSVLLAPNAIDVTEVVKQRLDMKMPSVKIELTAPPPGMQQQQQQQ
jgi:outer membrane protein